MGNTSDACKYATRANYTSCDPKEVVDNRINNDDVTPTYKEPITEEDQINFRQLKRVDMSTNSDFSGVVNKIGEEYAYIADTGNHCI